MNCLVTGAEGYIGHSLVKRLVKENYDVVGLIHKSMQITPDSSVKYLKGDITNFNSIKNAFEGVDIVFHCAAIVKDYGPEEQFHNINYQGTQNVVSACEYAEIKRFIYISRIKQEKTIIKNPYAKTKVMAEDFLIDKYKSENFPAIIIRPGNVYGPGANTWVLKPLKSIKKNRIALLDGGNGIFLHTYIENLIDALISSIKMPGIIGEIIEITDGDNSITWGRYLNDLSIISRGFPIKKNLSKKSALKIGKIMLILNKIFKIEPWVTPAAVNILSNKKQTNIEKAKKLLNYSPKINYNEGMIQVKNWLKNEGYV
jgi:nucleoside-diphosphate-sugar epimerase